MRKSYKLAARVLAKVIEAEIPNWHLQLGDGDKKEIILIQEQRQMKEKRKMETCIWRRGRGKAGEGGEKPAHVVACKWENFAHQRSQIEWNYQFKWNLHLLVVASQRHSKKDFPANLNIIGKNFKFKKYVFNIC